MNNRVLCLQVHSPLHSSDSPALLVPLARLWLACPIAVNLAVPLVLWGSVILRALGIEVAFEKKNTGVIFSSPLNPASVPQGAESPHLAPPLPGAGLSV